VPVMAIAYYWPRPVVVAGVRRNVWPLPITALHEVPQN